MDHGWGQVLRFVCCEPWALGAGAGAWAGGGGAGVGGDGGEGRGPATATAAATAAAASTASSAAATAPTGGRHGADDTASALASLSGRGGGSGEQGSGAWKSTDHYVVLGVPCDFTAHELKKTYRSVSLHRHPDRPGGSPEAFARAGKAYECLKDERCRRAFDEGEDLGRATGTGTGATLKEELERKYFPLRFPHEPFGDPFGRGRPRGPKGPGGGGGGGRGSGRRRRRERGGRGEAGVGDGSRGRGGHDEVDASSLSVSLSANQVREKIVDMLVGGGGGSEVNLTSHVDLWAWTSITKPLSTRLVCSDFTSLSKESDEMALASIPITHSFLRAMALWLGRSNS